MAEERELQIKLRATADVTELREAISSTSSLVTQIKEAEVAFNRHNQTSIQLKKAYKEFGNTGQYTAEQLREIGAQINESQANEQRHINTLKSLIEEYKQLGNAAGEGGEGFKQLEQRIEKAEGFITGITPAAKQAAAGMKQLGDEARQSNTKLTDIGGTLKTIENDLTSLAGKAATGLATGLGVAVVDQLQNAARAVGDFVTGSIAKFEEYDEAQRRILAQAPQLSEGFEEGLSAQAREISIELGRLGDETLPAIRKALNLNVSEDNLMTELARASGVARTEAADFEQTLVLGLSTLKAYNGAIDDSTKVYDRLTFLVQNSNLELSDLPGNFNGIVSAAGEAKVQIDDVVAAMITMNQQGDDISEISDLLSNMFTQIQIEGSALGAAFKQAAGVGFKEYIAEGGNLVGALELLQAHADEAGDSLLNLVGGSSPFFRDVQAARAVVELTGEKLDILRQYTDGVAESDGRAAAAQTEFANSTGFLRDQTEATTEVLQAQIGEALEPATRAWLEMKLAMAQALGGAIEQNQATQEAKDLLAGVASNYVEVLEVMKAVSEIEGTRGEKFDAEEIARRAQIAADLLEGGFKGSTAAFRDQIAAVDAANQRADAMTAAYQRQAAAAKEAGNAGIEGGEKAAEALQEQVNILEALDGDTFKVALNGEITDVRLTGVDTPETAKEWLNKAGMPFGEEALKFSQDFIMDPKLQVEITSDRQTYGRAIGQIINAVGETLDEALVRQGLALPLPVELTGSEEMSQQLQKLAAEAATAGRGIFEDEAVATAFLDGQIRSMEDVVAVWEQGKQKWAEFMEAFRGSQGEWERLAGLQAAMAAATTTTDIAAAQAELTQFNTDLATSYQNLALQQALSNVENAEALSSSLEYATAIGAITEEQAAWMEQQANIKTGLAEIDTQLKNQKLTTEEAAEAFRLLTEGMATTGREAIAAATSAEAFTEPYDRIDAFFRSRTAVPTDIVDTTVQVEETADAAATALLEMNTTAEEFVTTAIDAGIARINALEEAARRAAQQMDALVTASGRSGSSGSGTSSSSGGSSGGSAASNPSQVNATPGTVINNHYNIGAVTDDALGQLKDNQRQMYDRYGVSGQ